MLFFGIIVPECLPVPDGLVSAKLLGRKGYCLGIRLNDNDGQGYLVEQVMNAEVRFWNGRKSWLQSFTNAVLNAAPRLHVVVAVEPVKVP